ncbi:MAG: outer membrane protein assembly factor BamA [Desulfobacteraceae bacterium]|nr:outer membrane protein assembly factor BamA [Desulfobacteraceae bacterium]
MAVLPFEVYSQENLTHLQTEVQAQIATQLKNEGAVVFAEDILFETDFLKNAKSAEEIKQTGVELGVDYVIWGSITFIGEKFSIDARLAETAYKTMPIPLFSEGEGVSNINENIKNLSDNLGNIIFKREKIAEIRVEGNKRIEEDAILRVIKTKPGNVYRSENLSEDLKLVYSMGEGYFEDIRIEFEEGPKGRIIIFKVKEKPTLRKILVKGNIGISDEDIKSALDIKTGSILNNSVIAKSIKAIENLYIEKNVHHSIVKHNIKPLENNQSDLEFVIEEGVTIRIKSIDFEGNSSYSDKKLKKMFKTKEKGFLSWLTSSGELNIEQLNHDISKLTVFYRNNGFIQSKVGEPDIKYEDEWIYIKIKIQEGLQFNVGEINIIGDLLKTKDELLEGLKIRNEEVLNQEILRNDVLLLTDIYSDNGYYYADIFPRVDKDIDKKTADITFVVGKGKLVYFDQIIISGNTKTRDKVIRRELKIYEQELYSGRRMKEGIRNLHRLDFFEDIKVNPIKGDSGDTMTLKVDVTEKPTGAFTFGAGYSSGTGPFTTFSVSQNNLFGLGQILQVKADLGRESNQYNLSFTEPWLFDMPLSAGVNLYNLKVRYDTYDVDSIGGGFRFSYPVFDLTRASLSLS